MLGQSRDMALDWNPPRFPSQKTARHENVAGHATVVHEGAELDNGGRIFPRQFMTSAYLGPYGNYDALDTFVSRYRQTGNIAVAFRDTARGANDTMRSLIRFDGWPYDATTRRRNKTIARPPTRDIVDLGELEKSQRPVRFL